MPDNTYPLLTEDELDTALAQLHDTPAARPNLEPARAALYAALGRPVPLPRPSHRRWGRAVAAGAVVAAAVAGVLVAENVGGNQPTASAAALTLRQAATASIGEHDPVLRPGQYLYIRLDSLNDNMVADVKGPVPTFYFVQEQVTETWIPADRKANWRLRDSLSAPLRWITGTEQQAKAEGVDVTATAPTEITAPCGAFYASGTSPAACADAGPGNWQEPTPAWLAALPTDPAQLLAKLRKDIPQNLGDPEILTYVADALRGGQVPGRVRAVMYRALALLPDLKVTQQAANLNGGKGVALGVADPRSPVRQEIIVDPATGQFIGQRSVAQLADHDDPIGSVLSSSAVTTKVVDGIGQR
jgi:hypothetical protein